MPPKKTRLRQEIKRVPEVATEYVLPAREWDRATDLISLFIASGWIHDVRQQSLMLMAEPGSGKTELIDRFMGNSYLEYASDLTARGVYKILRQSLKGATSHIVASEFQKYLMRKASTADNMLGTLSQAMEEGVRQVLIGEKVEDFQGAKVGFIGAITDEAFQDYRKLLSRVGFISRCCIFRWGMTFEELQGVMSSIGRGDESDLAPVLLNRPERKLTITMAPEFSTHIQKYVELKFRHHSMLRVFNRFRALSMASAALQNRNTVTRFDVQKVFAFHPYWEIMASEQR